MCCKACTCVSAPTTTTLFPVIVVTGREVRGNLKRVIDAGAKAFLQKPVNNAKLLAVIRQALGELPKMEEDPVVYNLGNP
jgi:FixJ family two-component response regulator